MLTSERDLILGADIGGTSTRVVVAELTPTGPGAVLAVATGGAGNPNAVGLEESARQIAAVASDALGQAVPDPAGRSRPGATDPATAVRAAVIGMAGYGAVTDHAAFLAAALPGVEVAAVRVVPDFAIAFASATPEPSGYVVLAGTGAGAVQVVDGEVTARRDAWGWLLGDLGSGFWIGREAVRSTLTALQHGEAPGPLAASVLARTGTADLDALIASAYAHPPIWLAGLAPAVSETATVDPEARRISEQAAALLTEALIDLEPVPDRPVVTTGSVLEHHTVVRDALLSSIGRQLGNPVRHATSGLVGALWIAAPTSGDGEAEHARLVAAVASATPR